MSRQPITEEEALQAIRAKRIKEEQAKEEFLSGYPRSYPKPRKDHEWSAYVQLRNWWTDEQLEAFVSRYGTDEMVFPGILDTPGRPSLTEFIALVGLLAEGKYARTLPESEMLTLVAGEDAAKGRSYSSVQSGKSKLAHKARWGGRDEINSVLSSLAQMQDELGDPLPARELWTELYSLLDKEGMRPDETSGETPIDSDMIYWDGNDKGMSYKTFRNRISTFRNKK